MNSETLKIVYFYVCAAMAVAGALFTVGAINPIRGAMGLLLTISGIAALFLSLHAEFLAAVQLIVYAGAVVVLFLFAIMLLGPAALPPDDKESLPSRVVGAVGVGLLGVGGVLSILAGNGDKPKAFPLVKGGEGTIEAVAREVFGPGLVPFELASALLMVAVVGAVAVARGKQGEAAPAPRTTPEVHRGPRVVITAPDDKAPESPEVP
ncbi:MAG: NADH-quinone oxidoreductase subunit J [Polyangiaceae bacterium]|jgi:NADH-quinone oxidoreductase subunit J|nr:NADH-quinone oxidoreductase subunit J [Polyangiaceae bacterium]